MDDWGDQRDIVGERLQDPVKKKTSPQDINVERVYGM